MTFQGQREEEEDIPKIAPETLVVVDLNPVNPQQIDAAYAIKLKQRIYKTKEEKAKELTEKETLLSESPKRSFCSCFSSHQTSRGK